jgi:predicted XRE-type DNA-binding protein
MRLTTWNEHESELIEKGHLSDEEIRESDMRVALMLELIKARKDKNLTQRQLEELSGVRQPIIARMEKGTSIPNMATVMRVLAPLGMTLKIVPLAE